MQYTFFDLITDVFNEFKNPLSPDEIWDAAVEFGFDKKLGSSGKTPSATVGARLYVDVKENGDKSKFIQVSKRPSRFLLRSLNLNQDIALGKVKSNYDKVISDEKYESYLIEKKII